MIMARTRDAGDDDQHPKRLLTIPQLAHRWQVHPRTIRRKIEKNQIRVIRIGRAVRIHPDEAELGPDSTV
jgi:excisionase family DNA binding protein